MLVKCTMGFPECKEFTEISSFWDTFRVYLTYICLKRYVYVIT